MPSRDRAKASSAAEGSAILACGTAEGARPTVRNSVISAVVKLRREQIRMAPLCSRDREQRQLPTMEIDQRQGTWQGSLAARALPLLVHSARLHIGRKGSGRWG